MAGPAEPTVIRPPGPREDYKGPLGGFGWGLKTLDYWAYCTEKAIAVIALSVMVVIQTVYIVYENITSQKLAWINYQAGEGDFPTGGLVMGVFIAVLLAAVVQATRLGRDDKDALRPLWQRAVAWVVLMGATVLFMSLTDLVQQSSTFYLLLILLVMGPVVAYFVLKKEQVTAVALGVLSVVLMWLASDVPDGYSWADNHSLFLLMWMGFLGASMTTKEKGHIKLDITRKFCPPKFLNTYNIISDLVAASFTGLLLYLGYLYMFKEGTGRWWARTLEGEIPDWLVVMAIPLALLIIVLRLVCRAGSLIIAPEPPPEPLEAVTETEEVAA